MSSTLANFWLVAAFLAFIGAMAAVFTICVRERRQQAPLRHQPAESTSQSDAASDNRVALVIFGGIILGALLALLVGYIVFFSGLEG
jgi:small-conductance mechanosensitive channel